MRRLGLCAALGLLSVGSWARAEPPAAAPTTTTEDSAPFASALRVEVISCVLEESAVDVSEMLAIARAELAPHVLVRAGEKNSQPLLRVDACHDERLVLRLLSPEGPEQSVALHDVPPEHRPRVAALALAELVLTSRAVGEWRAERAAKGETTSEKPRSEPASTPAPKPPPPPPASAAQLPAWSEEAPPPRPRKRLGFGAEVRFFPQNVSLTYGPRIVLRLERVDLALLGLIGRRSLDLGTFQFGVVALNTAVHLWRSRSHVEAQVSLGAELGVSWCHGNPNAGANGSPVGEQDLFASGFGQATLGGAISDQASMHAGLAVGYARGVYADYDDGRAGIGGAFAGLSLGIVWSL